MIWTLAITLPLVLAFVVLCGKFRPVWYGLILGAGALPAMFAGIVDAAPLQVTWLLLESGFGLDPTRRIFLTFSGLLWAVAGIYAGGYLANDPQRKRFGFFFLLAMVGNIGLIAAEDLPAFYTFFVLMTFAAYGLVVHNGSRAALRAGRIYIIMAIMGELLLLAGVFLVVVEADSHLLVDMGSALAVMDYRSIALLLLLAGFGVKAGAIPLYFWLPLAHPVAPTPASAVLSGAMIKAGLLGWLHFSPSPWAGLPEWSSWLIAAGLLAAFGAVVVGIFQTDPKTNLAYSSISQMGLMTVVFAIGLASADAWQQASPAVALYAWNHGLAKGALFLGVGVALATRRGKGWVLAGLAFAAATIAGAPLTGGAVTKYGLKEIVDLAPGGWGSALLWLMPLSALGTSLLLGRFLWLCWQKMGAEADHGSFPALAGPWVALLAVVAVGVPWVDAAFGLQVPMPGFDFAGLVDASWPLVLAAAILWATMRFCRDRHPLPVLPAGDLLVLIEECLIRLRNSWYRMGLPDLRKGAINLVPLVDRIIALEGTRAIVDRTERRLGEWSVVGLLFVLILLGFVFFLS